MDDNRARALNEATSLYPSPASTLMAAICTTSRASPGPCQWRWCAPSRLAGSTHCTARHGTTRRLQK